MRSAETALQVIRDRGKRGLLLEEDVYRQLFNPNLYLLAYSRMYKNDGALTQGVTKETADGTSMKKIEDNRFLRLIENLIKAEYCEEWSYHPTLSGTPQGGIVSPILSNIYLDKLDKFVEQSIIPEHTRGQRRAENKEYTKLQKLAWYHRKAGHEDRAHELELQYQRMPSKDVNDPDYRRLSYLRYADDFLLAFIGPIA